MTALPKNFALSGLVFIGLVAVGTSAAAAEPQQQAQSAPVTTAYTTAETDIGTLLDNPEARAVLAKHAPKLTADSQFEMARSMTLKQIQSYASDVLSDDVLARIASDLAKLPKN